MRRFLLILFFITGFVTLKPQTWNIVNEPDIKSTINALYFFNANEGFFVGENSLVLYTNDGGKTLVQKAFPSVKSLKKVFFTDRQHGWIGANEGYVYYTTDGGNNWNEFNLGSLIVPQISFLFFDAMYFTNNKNGYAVAGKLKADYLFQTTDGGVSWFVKDSLVSSTAQRWYAIEFYGENNGVIVGDKKNIQKYTTDGGKTWTFSTTINDAFFYYLKTVKWLSPTTVIAMGDGNEFNGLVTPIYKSTDGGINWVKKTQNPINYDRVKECFFKNATDGIGVGSNGFSKMYYTKTTDGGETWTPYMGNFAMGLQAIHGSGDVLYALGTTSHILKSTDFGVTWSMLPYKTPSTFYGIQFIGSKGFAVNSDGDFFVNDNALGDSWRLTGPSGIWKTSAMIFTSDKVGFLLKDNNHIVKTTDAGTTWKTVLEASAFNSRSLVGGICFPTTNTGYAWCSVNEYAQYVVFKTTNAGDTWSQVYQVSGPGYISGNIGFFDENTGVMAGPKRWIQRTTNGGATWDSVVVKNIPATITGGDCEDLAIIDNSNAWIVGSGYIIKTSDKGATWNYIDHKMQNIDSSFSKILLKDSKTLYVTSLTTSKGSMLFKTTDAGSSWTIDTSLVSKYSVYSAGINSKGNLFFGLPAGIIISDVKPNGVEGNNNVISNFQLKQNYPNPFNPSTNISFELKNRSHVTLKVYDLMGREVAVLINDERPAGSYTVSFDAKNASGKASLASGVYYYRLQTDGFTETKKMILMR